MQRPAAIVPRKAAIRRKPVKKKLEGVITLVGAVLIMLLAVVVLVNDVMKLF